MKLIHLVFFISAFLLCQNQSHAEGTLGEGQNHNNGPLEGDIDFGGMSTQKKPPSPINAPGNIPHAGPSATSLTPGVRSGVFLQIPATSGTGSTNSNNSRNSSNSNNSNTNSDSKQFSFKVTAKESGPFNITAVVTSKSTRAPLVKAPERDTPPPHEEPEDPEAELRQRTIRAFQNEIDKRRQTNSVLQGHVDDLAGYMLKDLLRNSVIDATGTINQDLFNREPKPIQDALTEFESGHWGRDLKQATSSFANAAQSLTSNPDMFYVNQGRIEIERNNLFIQMLQDKINSLRAEE